MKQASLRDYTVVFEQERQALVKDLETMRMQLVRKDEQHKKTSAITSQQTVALKKEVAELLSQKSLVEKESELYQQKCKDLTTLLETSYDQHEEDQLKIVKLTETMKRLKKKFDDGVDMAKKEANVSVMNSHEERKSLKANAERLRCKLNAERKEWLDAKQALGDQCAELKTHVECLERELREARVREKSHRLHTEQMQAELRHMKHDAASAAQELQIQKLAIDKYKAEICRVVEDTRIKVECDSSIGERLLMAQEDSVLYLRSRSSTLGENRRLQQQLFTLHQKYERQMHKHDEEKAQATMLSEELTAFKRESRRLSVVQQDEASKQLKLLEIEYQKRVQQLQMAFEHEKHQVEHEAHRRLTLLEGTKTSQLEEARQREASALHETRMQLEQEKQSALNTVQQLCETTQAQLHTATKEKEVLHLEVRELQHALEQHREKERKLIQIMEHAQKLNSNLEEKLHGQECKYYDAQKQIDDMASSIKSLHATIQNQRELMEELDRSRQTKTDEHIQDISTLEMEKMEFLRQVTQLQEQHSQDLLALEVQKRNHDITVKQLSTAQLSANRLIEEQAKTIEDLLETRMAEPLAGFSTGICHNVRCGELADELRRLQVAESGDGASYATLLKQTNHQLQALEREKQKLLRVIEDQALTIHELTIQDSPIDDDDDIGGHDGPHSEDDGLRKPWKLSSASLSLDDF
ncbi:hypothetical protein SDRG_08815 [Saprolegnia diclina VS20]|uniref:Uncharacterized protein n=1 Tax=Saprolegnia diclina (strain VS20) TaxID=1156394 RepID=T0RTP5_SAPDV|nr:hypothetical protein SDRG_08815 [Saprolegnia diclina VS20]EQC33712.1 hypothetical protein SDRG_08815 [Saprolegnia diclina VS20]|eukprot:XP_008612935.1 hypothetical protein SDRG_08815 [Saprolegnia diclina VS20]